MKGNCCKDAQLNYSLTNKSSNEKIMIFTHAAFINQKAADNTIIIQLTSEVVDLQTKLFPELLHYAIMLYHGSSVFGYTQLNNQIGRLEIQFDKGQI